MNRPSPDTFDEKKISQVIELLNSPKKILETENLEWLSDSSNLALYEEMRKYREAALSIEMSGQIDSTSAFESFMKVKRKNLFLSKILHLAPYAAVFALVFTVAFSLIYLDETDHPLEAAHVSEDMPAVTSFKATLTTATGESHLFCDSSSSQILAKVTNVKTNNGIDQSTKNRKSAVEYHSLSTPVGGNFCLTLSDSSKVWLNSETKLTYPTAFKDSIRLVQLDGEAYFEVKSNKRIPFVVKTSSTTTRVYGTEFNTKAYDDSVVDITLIEGKISVKTRSQKKEIFINPGENIHVEGNAKPVVTKVDVRSYTAWKDGYFYYKESSLHEIIKDIQKWYDVEIQIDDPALNQLNFDLWIPRDATIENVIEVIEQTNTLRFINKGEYWLVKRQK